MLTTDGPLTIHEGVNQDIKRHVPYTSHQTIQQDPSIPWKYDHVEAFNLHLERQLGDAQILDASEHARNISTIWDA